MAELASARGVSQRTITALRSRSLRFFVLQGCSSALSFLCWAAASHLLPQDLQVDAATALGWGLVLYLPLTLGLPYLLPNLHREETPQSIPARRRLISTLVLVSLTAVGIGLVLGVAGVFDGGGTTSAALAFSLAGGLVLSITAQQQARIADDLRLMAVAAAVNIVLPVSWLASAASTRSAGAAGAVTAAVFLGYAASLAVALAPRRTRGAGDLASLLRRSLPLVPHLLAFAVLNQGIRFTTAIYAPGSSQLLTAHFIMTFVSIGFTVVVGVQAVVSVDVQMAAREYLRERFLRSLRALLVVGCGVSVVVVVAYASPARALFRGAAPPTLDLLATLILPVPVLAAFLAVSNLLVREEHTVGLAIASCSVSSVYVVASLLLRPTSPAAALGLWDAALAALLVLVIVLTVRSSRAAPDPAA